MNEAVQLITTNIIQLAFTVIAAVVSVCVIPRLTKYFQSLTQSELLDAAMSELEHTAQSIVNATEQTIVKQLKADGKWNTENQKKVLADAAEKMINELSLQTKKVVEENGASIAQLAVRYIESEILKSKSNN